MKKLILLLAVFTVAGAHGLTLKGADADKVIAAFASSHLNPSPSSKGELGLKTVDIECEITDGSKSFVPYCWFKHPEGMGFLAIGNTIVSIVTEKNQHPDTTQDEANAMALIGALRLAGVKPTQTTDSLKYSAKSIGCTTPDGSDMDNMFLSTCDVVP